MVSISCYANAYDMIFQDPDLEYWKAYVIFVNSTNTSNIINFYQLNVKTIQPTSLNTILVGSSGSFAVSEIYEGSVFIVQLTWTRTINGVSVTLIYNSSQAFFSFYETFGSSHLLLLFDFLLFITAMQ